MNTGESLNICDLSKPERGTIVVCQHLCTPICSIAHDYAHFILTVAPLWLGLAS